MESQKTRGIVLQTIVIVGAALAVVIFSFLSWFFITHRQGFSTDIGDWAAFGDYFGGLMNPVVAGAALFLLARSLIVQQQELSETRKALTEASKSQAKQARLAAQQAEIEINKMAFEKVNILIQAELSYLQSWVNLKNSQYSGTTFDREGQPVFINDEIDRTKIIILNLRDLQDKTILIANKIISRSDQE